MQVLHEGGGDMKNGSSVKEGRGIPLKAAGAKGENCRHQNFKGMK